MEKLNLMIHGHQSERAASVSQNVARRGAGPAARLMAAKKENILEMFIYGQIGETWYSEGVTAAGVAKSIKDAGAIDRIALRINSPGGSVFEGAAIYTQLHAAGVPIDVRVDGLAASAAFTIAMSGSTIEIGESAMMMLHNAWGMAMGEASDMRKEADLLDKISEQMAGIYAKRSGQSLEEVMAMMSDETWLTPKEAVEKGFANTIITGGESAKASAKHWNMAAFARTVPEAIKATACECPCVECMDGDCAKCSDIGCDCDGCDCDQEPAALDYSLHERRLKLAGYQL